MIKLPKKVYVTFQRRSKDEPRLGFMSPFAKDAAFDKRKATQDQWAYRSYYNTNNQFPSFKITEDESVVLESGDGTTTFMLNCYPAIMDNVPLEGYSVSKTVRRGGGWSGSSTVWRIYDPRDFELEIRAENMAKLLDYCTIINGEIQGKCVWARDGAHNILLPEGSDLYKQAVRTTEILNKKMSLKDVQVGDKLDIINPGYETHPWIYLGSFKMYYVNYYYASDSNANPHRFERRYGINNDLSELSRYLFTWDGEIVALTKPKISSIVGHDDSFNDETALQFVNDQLDKGYSNFGGYSGSVIFVSKKAIKFDEMKFALEDCDYRWLASDTNFPVGVRPSKYNYVDEMFHHRYFTEINGITYVTKFGPAPHVPGQGNYYNRGKVMTLNKVDGAALSIGSFTSPRLQINHGRWGGNSYEPYILIPDNPEDLKFKVLTAEYNGVKRKLVELGIRYG